MRSPILVALLWALSSASLLAQSTYSFQKKIRQSPAHDAIQLYYALQDFQFYPQAVAPDTYEIKDSRLGNTGIYGSLSNGYPEDVAGLLQQDLKAYAERPELKFQDAEQRQRINSEVFLKIMRRIAQLPSNASWEQLQEAYATNPFLKKYFEDSEAASLQGNREALDVEAFFSTAELERFAVGNSAPFLNFSLSALTQGVSDFLIERANEELNAAVFQRLKEQMEQFEEFPVLFPDSKATLDEIDSYNYNVAINALKTKFTRDIQQLPFHAGDLATLPKYQQIFDAYGGFSMLFSGLDLLKGLQSGIQPAALIQEMYASPYIQSLGITNEVSHLLRLSGFLSFALGNITDDGRSDNDQGWFNWSSLEGLPGLDKVTFLQLYFGILYQVAPQIEFVIDETNTLDFKELLAAKVDQVEELEQLILSAQQRLLAIQTEVEWVLYKLQQAQQLDQPGIDLSQFEHYINIAESVLGIGTDALIEFPDLQELTGFLAHLEQLQAEYLPLLEDISNLVQSVALEEYNAVIFDFGILFKRVLQEYYYQLPEIQSIVEQIKYIQERLKEFGTPADQIEAWKAELEALEKQLQDALKDLDGTAIFNEFIYCFLEYGNLIASIALAENGGQVKAAIRATALPVGGSSVKKHSGFNVAVNGYLGYYYRPFEDTTLVALGDSLTGFTRRHGVYAPIGISLSTGLGKAGSLTAYGGLLDLGAIVSFRLEDGASVPEVRLVNIFSPTVQLIYGFPYDLPFSLGAGWQWLPGNSDQSSGLGFNTAFHLFLGVDIPLYHIYNEKKVSVLGLFE
ncbi:MAG: hypothetical protein KDC44_10395 [Phaeodactylibacter sp.]|nr:hypothetical protein [Phaeodactylibacter sp.]